MNTVLALGAEAQAASSLVLAYPDRFFVLVSDEPIIDGWDLPNARIIAGDTFRLQRPADISETIVLHPRWLAPAELDRMRLSSVMPAIESGFPGLTLRVDARPPDGGIHIAKGDRWHRPDAFLVGGPQELADIRDTHGCGLVYQPYQPAISPFLAVGRRLGARVAIAILHVRSERFFRDVVLQAAETVDEPELLERSLRVLEFLGHDGFFAINWLKLPGSVLLSSFRPVPRAAFGALRTGDADVLDMKPGVRVARPGLRFIADPHYSSYTRLSA